MDTPTDALAEAVSGMLRRFDVSAAIDEEGQTIVTAAAAPVELPPQRLWRHRLSRRHRAGVLPRRSTKTAADGGIGA